MLQLHSPFFIFLLLLLLSLLLTTAHCQEPVTTLLMIDAGASPETNSSLQYHLCGEGAGKLGSNTTLQLSGGVHYLEEGSFCLLKNLKNFKIQGQQTQPRTVIYCRSGTEMRRGIAFFNISNLHFSYLDIVNCGREVPSTLVTHINNAFLYLGRRQKAVVLITHSINTTFQSVSIERCFGLGMIFINPLGSTLIENVSVADTNSSLGISECTYSLEKRNDMLCAGSGVVFIFNDTSVLDRVVKDGNYTAYLNIINCSFFNNTNMVPVYSLDDVLNTLAFGLAKKQFILVGGMTIAVVMGQKNYFVNLRVANTALFSNTGNIGNFIVVQHNELRNGVTCLDRVVLSDNTVVGGVTSIGAGLVIGVILFLDSLSSFSQSHEDIHDLVEITSSDFSRNFALWGAALWFIMTPQNISSIRLVVRDTSFTNNVAFIGPALYVFQSDSFIKTKEIYVYLEDIVASGNSFPEANISENSPENSGALFLRQISNITVVGTEGKGSHFHNNTVSALLAVATNVVLRGRITFEDNHGFRGGALNLVDTSILLIHNGSNMTFTRNTAFQEGGAIYINTGSAITGTCAIQFLLEKHIHFLHEDVELLNTSVVFVNNSAVTAGNSIFGNPLYHCLFLHISLNKYIFDVGSYEIIYKKVFDFQSLVGNNRSELNSVKYRICICSNITFDIRNCTSSLLQLLQPKYKLNHAVIPGDTFVLFLNPIDVGRNPVTSFLYSFPRSANFSDSVSLDSHQNIRLLPGLTHSCSSVEFTVHAPENAMLEIDLFASIGRQKVTIELNTTSCPPGFEIGSPDGSKRLSCVCNKFVKERLRSTCNLTDYTVVRPPNYWIGTTTDDNGGQILQYVSTCPTDYCKEDVTHIDLRVPNQVCAKGRTGTLCGACREGLSSVFGTAECQKCSHAWIALFPLFTLVGVIVVITSLLLDLTITHGLINGFFFYSCIVVVNSNIIFFQRDKSGFLFWFLSWTDMESGFSMCFYDGMTEPAKLGLQYVFPTYTIVMIVVIIVLSQHSLLMQRIFSQFDGIHVLVSMLYISFLKLFHTVIDTFTFVNVVSENGEEDVVWFFDGTHQVSDPISVFLILLGSLTMASFILPYVVFFTFSTYIQRYINSTRLNAYVDASLAPYKHKLRFWFGVRLILTSLIYIIIANRGIDNPTFTLTLEVSLLVGFTIIQAYICPFKRIGVALLDIFFLLNLIALTLGTLYTIQNENRYFDQKILVNTSVSISFVTFIGIILWHLLKRLRKNAKIKSKTDEMLASATIFLLGLKMKKRFILIVKKMKRGVMTKSEGEQTNRAEGAGGVLESTKYFTERSESAPPTTTTTIISLKEMVAAPDDWQSQQSTSCQLREPVLDLVEK